MLSYFFLKDNRLSFKIIIGLFISTSGALLISMKSICENLKVDKKPKTESGTEGTELENKEEDKDDKK